MSKILLTGATGFIGKELLGMLEAADHTVVAVNSSNGDIAEPATWDGFPPTEIVIHLAARTFVPDSWKDPAGFLRTNLSGTICALEHCRKHNARFIFLSSYLYGNPASLPIPETADISANNPYTLSKIMAEEMCAFYANNYGLSILVLRPFNVYGPGQNANFLIPSIIHQVISGTPVRINDLNPRRDYIFVKDLISAIMKSISYKSEKLNIFNLGTGTSFSVAEVIDLIQEKAGTHVEVLSSNERRQGEVMDTRADISKAEKVLRWSPEWSLQQGIAAIVEAAKKGS